MSIKYNTAKGQHIQQSMAEGKTHKQAVSRWNNSAIREELKTADEARIASSLDNYDPIDRSGEWADYAQTSDDF